MNHQSQPTPTEKGILEKHVQTILLSVVTAGMIALFGFLWNLNKELAIMQTRDIYKTETITALQIQITKLQSDFLDFKERIREDIRNQQSKK